jgi:hypothetical protein
VEALHVGAAVEVLGDLLPVLAVVQVHGGAELVVLGKETSRNGLV